MERQYVYGAVPRTYLTVTINAADTSIVLADATGWPTTGPFTITIERDTANEEKISIASRSGSTLTVASSGRGYDGTTARSHTSGTTCYVEHTIDATFLDNLNEALARPTQKGTLITHDGTDLVNRTVGTNGLPLRAASTQDSGMEWAPLDAIGINANAVTTVKILDSNVTTAKINDGAVTSAKVTGPLDAQARVAVRVDGGSDLGPRRRINLITGSGITIAGADDAGNEEVDVTLTGKSYLVAVGTTNTQVVNSTTPTNIVSLAIPSGSAVAGALLRCRFVWKYYNDSAGSRNITARVLGGTTQLLTTGTISHGTAISGPVILDVDIYCIGNSEREVNGRLTAGQASLGTADDTFYTQAYAVQASWNDSTLALDLSGAWNLNLEITLGTASASLHVTHHSSTVVRSTT